jgi:hypothetical protein
MENIIEYVEKNMQGMAAKGFNAVDSLVLSKLAYVRFEHIVPSLAERASAVRIGELLRAEMFGSMFLNMSELENNKRFLFALAASPRFRNIHMNHYIDNSDTVMEKQFAAVTFFLEDKTAYIAFRGTDSTFVGWKEDFNMAYISPVPSQEESVKYVNAVARRNPFTRVRIGGHSKGGNLAVYASIKCEPAVQKRIISVFNHDGPGFKDSILQSPAFFKIKDRIHTTLPESSLVGMLLQHHEDYLVIKSNRHGIMQHEPFSWIVENDDFCYVESIKNDAMIRSNTLNVWLNALTDEKRKLIVNVLFQVLETTDAETFQELSEDWYKSAVTILGAVKNIDPESKKFVLQTINALAKLSFKNLFKR